MSMKWGMPISRIIVKQSAGVKLNFVFQFEVREGASRQCD